MNSVLSFSLAAVVAAAALSCSSCSSKQEEVADRVEAEISPAQIPDADERRAAAEALAEDLTTLGEEHGAIDTAQAEATRQFEAARGTVAQVMARECEELQHQLGAMQRSTDILTPEESAQRQIALEETRTRIARQCP